MGFNTKECEWSSTSVAILGRKPVGITGFEFEKNIEKEYLFGAGSEPIDIQMGNKTYPGSVTLLKYEVDLLNDAALSAGYEDILEVPHTAIVITCQFKATSTSKIRTITATGCAFDSLKAGSKQNDKKTEMAMPFKAMKTVLR